jgi:hypothetical protein
LPAPWPRYTWDSRVRQYRGASGRLVSRTAVRQALDEAIDGARQGLATTAERLRRGVINLPQWQIETEALVKSIHVMSAALAAGGWAQATAKDWSIAANRIKADYLAIERLARKLESGALPADGRLAVWASTYGVAGSGTYETVLRRRDLATGRVIAERRRLHSAQPCFVAGTLVDTDRGQVPIERIRAGDRVLTRIGYRSVLSVSRTPYRGHLIHVTAGGRSVVCTPEHPFLTARGWVNAGSLTLQDRVVLREHSADEGGVHVALPDADDRVATGPKVGVPRSIAFLLCPLSFVQRLEPWMAVPPVPIGFDDESADPNVDDEGSFDDRLGFVGDADFVEDGPELPFQTGGLVPLGACPDLGHSCGVLGSLVIGSHSPTDPFCGTGPMGRVVCSHPLAVNLGGNARNHLGDDVDAELSRPAADRRSRLPDSRHDPRRPFGGIELADDLVFLGRVAKVRSRRDRATSASLAVVVFATAARRAYRRLFRRVMAPPASLAQWLRSLTKMAALRTSNLLRPWGSRAGTTPAAKGFDPFPVVPAFRAGIPDTAVDDSPRRDAHDDPSQPVSMGYQSVLYDVPVDVFNLEVDGLPEYVAGGFVVHNCKPCLRYHALDWQPPGVLPDIGQECLCHKRCRCTFQRRFAKPGEADTERTATPRRPRTIDVRKPGIAARPRPFDLPP